MLSNSNREARRGILHHYRKYFKRQIFWSVLLAYAGVQLWLGFKLFGGTPKTHQKMWGRNCTSDLIENRRNWCLHVLPGFDLLRLFLPGRRPFASGSDQVLPLLGPPLGGMGHRGEGVDEGGLEERGKGGREERIRNQQQEK